MPACQLGHPFLHENTYHSLLMKTLDHVTEPLDIRVITQDHSHCRRNISFPCQMRNGSHVRSKVGSSLRNRWRWVSDFISPTRCLPIRQRHIIDSSKRDIPNILSSSLSDDQNGKHPSTRSLDFQLSLPSSNFPLRDILE